MITICGDIRVRKIKIEKLSEFMNYYGELERLLEETEEFIAIDEINFQAYSIKYNWLYQSICSEIDVLLKELALYIDSSASTDNINQCKKTILQKYASIQTISVEYPNLQEAILPWEAWSDSNPIWWQTYNKVKHHRVDRDSDKKIPNYKFANQRNVL